MKVQSALTLLVSRRRRHLLYHLTEDSETNMEAASRAVSEFHPVELGEDDVATLRANLCHQHIPKLEEQGIVSQSNGTIHMKELPLEVRIILSVVRTLEVSVADSDGQLASTS